MAKKEKFESGTKVKLGTSDKVIRVFGYIFISLYALACLIPFLIIVSTSFTAESTITREGVQLIPKNFSLDAYQAVLKTGLILKSYALTITMTATGTFVGLLIISMTGYALQRRDYPFRNAISFYIYFTSLFSAGLVPYYLTMTKTYKLMDSYFAVWLPLLMSPWLIILMKNFIKAIPHEITESGKIDGAGDFRIYLSLILPSITPALATIGLFLALSYWNEWYQSSLFLSSQVEVKPLQFMLYNVVNSTEALKSSVAAQYVNVADIPTTGVKMATAVLATGPVVLFYPFVQKYFISGLTVGAVKG